MRLPDLPVGDIQNRREMVTARGLNYSDNIQDGDLAECRILGPNGFEMAPLVNPVKDLKKH